MRNRVYIKAIAALLALTLFGCGQFVIYRIPRASTSGASSDSSTTPLTGNWVVSNLAGVTFETIDGTGSSAKFAVPTGAAVDSSGNIFIAEAFGHVIRKVTPAGVVTTFAGQVGTQGNTDGPGASASFNEPVSVAIDSSDNLYVADLLNHTIRKVTPAGVVSTLAGSAGLSGSADGAGAAARFNAPISLSVDASDDLYVADSGNSTIRKITAAGIVTTFAGTALATGSADGTGAAARFNLPYGVAVDKISGNIYVAEYQDSTIRAITPGAVVTTLAGSPGFIGTTDDIGGDARFNTPSNLVVDTSGDLYVADSGNYTIRKVTSAGVVTTFLGTAGVIGHADGSGAAAVFATPFGITINAAGTLYIAEFSGALRKATAAGAVTTLAGTASYTGSADGTGEAAHFYSPQGLVTDSSGNVFITDGGNETIRKITPAGVVTTFAGTAGASGSADGTGAAARFNSPFGIGIDSSDNLYVADSGNFTIRKITPAGVVTTFAGTAGISGSTDATGAAASFFQPAGIAVDQTSGNIYVADASNYNIRKITPAGVVTTLAGTAGLSGDTDATGAAARFHTPMGIAVDSTETVYVADYGNSSIRKITTAGVVTTYAGTSGATGSTDGTGAAARFYNPGAIAADSAGNLFVSDSNNATIRLITSGGEVTTIAGSAGVTGGTNGAGVVARFTNPWGISVDASGNIYVADADANAIRKITP